MLNLKKVLGAKPKEHVKAELEELLTPWGEALDAEHVLEEHPTPQFRRDHYQVLNGTWACVFAESKHDPNANLASICAEAKQPPADAFGTPIVVPFSSESPLSGVRRQLQPDELLWYRRTFLAPMWIDAQGASTQEAGARTTAGAQEAGAQEAGANEAADARAAAGAQPDPTVAGRCLLHFQAVDYACACFVNGQLVGTHEGGYLPFTFDITDELCAGVNELAVCVADPSEFGGHVRGKQRFDRGDIWYTAQSGIWQTVWMEVVPAAHLTYLQVEPDLATGVLVVGVETSGLRRECAQVHPEQLSCGDFHPRFAQSAARGEAPGDKPSEGLRTGAASPEEGHPSVVRVEVLDANGRVVAVGEGAVENGTGAVAVQVPHPHAWSPNDPYLYGLRLTFGDDVVHSYCGFRTVEMRHDAAGHKRVFLNGEPLFIRGVLDQAYWSDGLMTAPADDALVFDIQAMRDAGFNLMRKHIKVESARWYYHCDRLGMLVLQDMVQGGDGEIRTWDWSYKPTLFKISWNHYRDDTLRHQEKLGAGSAAYRAEWARDCRETVRVLRNSPSIIGWSLFNEGWGQFNACAAYNEVRRLDPTRVIDAVSGWYDQGCGDFYSVHNYFRDLAVWPCRRGRAFLVSEFGGFSHRVEGHSSLPECYGYEIYDDIDEWRTAVRALIAHMNTLEASGLTGYIYTQVSDIEEETNGLLTYDRRVNKL